MKRNPTLGKLLKSTQIETLLEEFASLLGPEVALAVSDGTDRLVGSCRSFSSEIARVLVNERAVQEATETVAVSQ